MKKKLLKLGFLLSTVVVMFSSCLGDGESTFKMQGDYAYIRKVNGTMYAYTNKGGTCTSTDAAFQSIQDGSFVQMSYKVGGVGSNGVSVFKEWSVTTMYAPADQAQLQEGLPEETIENEVYPTSLDIFLWTRGNYFGDRWMFNVGYKLGEDETIRPIFYYDESNIDDTDKVTLDVRFVKEGNGGNATSRSELFVANLSKFRDYYPISWSGSKEKDVLIRFRYNKSDNKGGFTSEVGTFSTDGYRLTFSQPE